MKRFMECMSFIASLLGWEAQYIIHGYDWATLGSGTMVDVASNHDHMSKALSRVFPNLKIIVQDLQTVIVEAKRRTDIGAKQNIELQAHNMFTPQPIRGADVYFMRAIMHDYSDMYSAKILQNIIPAMEPNSRIIISDIIMPPPGTIPCLAEKALR